MLRLFLVLLSFGAVFGGNTVYAAPGMPPVETEPIEPFATPAVMPTPVPTRADVTECSGEGCMGVNPYPAGCMDYGEVELLDTVYVRDGTGVLVGKLQLVQGCDGNKWGVYSSAAYSAMHEVRIVQERTGVATEWIQCDECVLDVTVTPMFFSPDAKVRAEVTIWTGKTIVTDHTRAL